MAIGVYVFIAALSLASCKFEPEFDPLLLPTAPPNPFSDFSVGDAPVEIIPPQQAAQGTSPQGSSTPQATFVFPSLLAPVAGAAVGVIAALAGFTFLQIRNGDRPSIAALIIIGVLLTLAILLVEILFIIAEAIMLLSGVGETPIGVVLGLVLAVLGLFLINLEIAYVVFVYRVVSGPPGGTVKLILWPWELWGLGGDR